MNEEADRMTVEVMGCQDGGDYLLRRVTSSGLRRRQNERSLRRVGSLGSAQPSLKRLTTALGLEDWFTG
jgi:hypothetical protein